MILTGAGRVDRSDSVRFRFDDRWMTGAPGDMLASALMANDVSLVGRSFKYHRPRGILTAGSEEPNALVTVGRGAGRVPNTRATMQELFPGLAAESQNRWPSLAFDALAVNELAAPFLSAGFYYKTFMWPKAFWEKLYEPFIRRAAGLGALSRRSNADRYEKAFAFCDVLVIGAGPAGLMAALTAANGGADVILADENAEIGGRLRFEVEEIDGTPCHRWADQALARLQAMPNVRIMTRTTVTGAYDQGTYGALERVAQHVAEPGDAPLECFWRIVSKRAILCAGAIERPIAFRDNDRPGVMTAGAMRAFATHWGVAPARKVAVFGNTDDVQRTARDLSECGVDVVATVDARPDAPAVDSIRHYPGCVVCRAHGGQRGLKGITIRRPNGSEYRIEAGALAMNGGWNPTVHLTCHMGGRPVWRDDIAAFVPADDAVPGMSVAGAANGAFSTAAALREGVEHANAALQKLNLQVQPPDSPDASDAPYRIEPLWQVPGQGRAWLDFQNDVTVKDVELAAQENFRSVEHMKRYTTQGMAPDQGKNSNVAALAVLANATGRDIPGTGTTTFRPPFVPVSIAAMGAGSQGQGFAPQRFTTSHAKSVEMGAPMIEAGLWYRPSYFPRAGERTWRDSCDREVRMVREAVGICDVSTLGKIDIQGPDAAAFLDFVYTNTFSTLKVGRVRYGLMLREDGHVMDDGTTARLGDTHFVMTTTTAAAGLVMRHLDFVHQALCSGLDVRFTSATEQWAQFAVAGPKSVDIIRTLCGDTDLPFMGCAEVDVLGVSGRLFRISFSGEHAYEVAVPARYGAALFDRLVAEAEALGGGAYGMEALNVLRIEKGFITHAEIHGRTTAFDIGMQGMVSKKKDCIGKTMSERPGLMADREELVGLRPVKDGGEITAGAHLFDEGAAAQRVHDRGYVTSVGWSPTLGTTLALGFLKDGRAKMGQRVKMVDHLRGITTLCEVTDTVAFDADGGRMRG